MLALVNKNSDIADAIRSCNCGFIVNQGDVDWMVKQLKFCFNNRGELEKMGKRARNYFEEHFTIERSIEGYVKMLNVLLGTTNSPIL